ncbi:MAG TPA: 5'/3'-nucleotidase SurE [bacterium]|nr:5'/3'-nucleotidase SurE [bacterium]HPS30456.1 5'/3'-nucleotidase SurE [bacterium]
MKNRIFLTNDDGVYAGGLNALEAVLTERNIPFFTTAPMHENSGAGHSITLEKPLRAKKIDENRYAVTGTPTDAVFLGLHSLSDSKPRFAISGINRGGNLANDITYSGTVAAAIETFYNGITSFAVSLYIEDYTSFSEDTYKAAAEIFFDRVIPEIELQIGVENLYSAPYLFNINIPDSVCDGKKHEIKWTHLGKRHYGGEVIKRLDPRGHEYYWIGGTQNLFSDIAGSDCNAVTEGSISITPLLIQMTDEILLQNIRKKK